MAQTKARGAFELELPLKDANQLNTHRHHLLIKCARSAISTIVCPCANASWAVDSPWKNSSALSYAASSSSRAAKTYLTNGSASPNPCFSKSFRIFSTCNPDWNCNPDTALAHPKNTLNTTATILSKETERP